MGRKKELRQGDLDSQIDDLFAGPPSREESFAGIARHLAGARSQLVQTPTPEVRERHLAAMMEEAKALTGRSLQPTPKPSAARRLRVAALKLGAGASALSLSTAGLAYAGVDLPGKAAAEAFEVVGIELPNQADGFGGGSVAEAVQEVIENSEETGCEFGQAVAEAASQNRQDEPKSTEDRCPDVPRGPETAEERSGSKSNAHEGARGGSSKGAEKAAEGKARADENKAAAYEKSGGKGSAHEKPSGPASDATQPNRGGSGDDRGSGASERSLPVVPDVVESVKEKRSGGKPDGAGR